MRVSNIGSPGSYKLEGQSWQADPNCDPSQIRTFGSNTFCSYRFSDFSTELPELRQLNLMSLFDYETDSGVTVYGRLNATKKQVKWTYAAAPGQFTIPGMASTIGIPGYTSGDVTVRYRAVDLGNRETEIDNTAFGFQAGAKGSVTSTGLGS